MDVPGPATKAKLASSGQTTAQVGLRQLRVASGVGLTGQVLVWGSAIALWVVGTVFSPIPVSTKIAYGANGILVSAGAVFALNYVLIAGAAVALVSLLFSISAFQKLGKASLPINFEVPVSLTTIGIIGLAMFALGWAIWLGSFVAPGAGPNSDSSLYTPILASNLTVGVDLLLLVGGLLAFPGMLGIAIGHSRLGSTLEEGSVELGGAILLVPVFSVIGYALSLIGLARGARKLGRGWTPPPPPPAPSYPAMNYPGVYFGGPPMVVPSQRGSWDTLAIVLVVTLVLLWVFILPISLFTVQYGPSAGPGVPGGGGTNSTPSPLGGFSSEVPLLLVGLAATAVLLPLAVARNRRKRQPPASQPMAPPPPPPPPPRKQAVDDDPLDHLV